MKFYSGPKTDHLDFLLAIRFSHLESGFRVSEFSSRLYTQRITLVVQSLECLRNIRSLMWFVASGRSQVSSAILDVGESASFEVCYHASVAKKSQGQIMLRVVDNQYEDCIVHLVAEAYHDDITIYCVPSVVDDVTDDVTVIDGDIAG